MNNNTRPIVTIAALLIAGASHATSIIPTERVKTGIHPEGGFYKIYEVRCNARNTTTIASLERNKRWCFAEDAQMTCFREKQVAANNACNISDTLAATGELATQARYR